MTNLSFVSRKQVNQKLRGCAYIESKDKKEKLEGTINYVILRNIRVNLIININNIIII